MYFCTQFPLTARHWFLHKSGFAGNSPLISVWFQRASLSGIKTHTDCISLMRDTHWNELSLLEMHCVVSDVFRETRLADGNKGVCVKLPFQFIAEIMSDRLSRSQIICLFINPAICFVSSCRLAPVNVTPRCRASLGWVFEWMLRHRVWLEQWQPHQRTAAAVMCNLSMRMWGCLNDE